MRVEELCSLKIKDLEPLQDDNWRLHMIAKGLETHAPIIHRKTAHLLKDYIQQFRSFAQKDDFLFVSSALKEMDPAVKPRDDRASTPLHRTSVFHMIKICAKEAGIEKNISPHSCRATLATLLHQNGVPIAQIQSLLNHKQMTTTSIYIKKSDELAQAAATKIDLLD
jgi:integrase/recombinase XerD